MRFPFFDWVYNFVPLERSLKYNFLTTIVTFTCNLFYRETQKKPLRIDVRKFDSLYYSKFNKSHPTKIIIHGFGGGRNLIPSPDLRKGSFLKN